MNTPIIYGYKRAAFRQQQAQLVIIGDGIVANVQGIMYPFFSVKFVADGPQGSGSLWVATNRCLGDSATCVHMAEKLNLQPKNNHKTNQQAIDTTAFSVAMSGTEARLFVSWKQYGGGHSSEDAYHMAEVRSFALQDPAHHIEFRRYVLNIIDWGQGQRLNAIRESLSTLGIEEVIQGPSDEIQF